jgi:hypothetical protein
MGRVALEVAGEPTTRYRRAPVAELCDSTNKIPTETTQFKQFVLRSSRPIDLSTTSGKLTATALNYESTALTGELRVQLCY